jgi:hypothetical protein
MDLEDIKFHMDSGNKIAYDSTDIEKKASKRSPWKKTQKHKMHLK